jgi:hypothetical protein
MDAFAKGIEGAAGWSSGALEATYYETEDGGLKRLAESDAAFALVPLPFFLKHAKALALAPKLAVVEAQGPTQIWSLVAKKGSVTKPASLDGWEVTGTPGYAPAFVRRLALGGWGDLPAGVKITPTARSLSALRRAAAGEKVAVLLDTEGTSALASLPFASDLEVVTRSKPLPGTLLCRVGDRVDDAAAEKLSSGLLHLHEKPEGAELLKSLRMTRFERADAAAIAALRKAVEEPSGAAR